ncbi:glutamine--tRNA ligase [Synoicihabitans lomoniglobus]|uniref:Glutamine--tRNA ligase n=1 Tax=Synoicihabitans lomoniglobus TaxID=2909285 RepID=A0AAF0CS61_9BACT|nr:glutamine--tRNA ligase [Opitutaceae bacterium LMO-M01]WED67103.1 glutamine--tRNA ligase [Opitutaceae bacterium LMO-M01]
MSDPHSETPPAATPSDFIRDIIAADIAAGRTPQIVTRFPPEPNGYLHLGHAKSICLNFGIAVENHGRCNLRFDDTNPVKEDTEYVDSITTDIRWLISGWADGVLGEKPRGAPPSAHDINGTTDFIAEPAPAGTTDIEPFFTSDYFEQLYTYAEKLIMAGKAFVCDLTPEETEAYRGTPTEPGRNSPHRDRSIEENLDLFRRMRAGEFPDSARTLRAKIDMASPNVWLRDPLIYRIRHIAHHHAGAGWCIYPLYDFAHCLSDYLEGITHSLCTLEFEVHRPLYDWILKSLELPRTSPRQIEFAKLNLAYTLFSKRRLMRLVQEGHVDGWDDPRLPTLAGLRRRGVPAAAVRNFAYRIGITKFDSVTEAAVYEGVVRDELNAAAERRMGVLAPLKLVLTNLAPDEVYACEAGNHPQDESLGSRPLRLTREVYIESDDFAEIPPPKFRRLKPGGSVRLKYGCIITCDEVIKDAEGHVTEVHCTADLTTRRGQPNSNQKVKGTIHWVSATDAVDATVRLYDRLFTVAEPGAEDDFTTVLNPESLVTVAAKIEPALAQAPAGVAYQFERLGYFTADAIESTADRPVFNRTITLRDTWSK